MNLRTLLAASALFAVAATPTIASAQRYYRYHSSRAYARPVYPVLPYYTPYHGYSDYAYPYGSGVTVYLGGGSGHRSYGPRYYGHSYGYSHRGYGYPRGR